MKQNTWNLFIDDVRFPYVIYPSRNQAFVVARNVAEAKGLVLRGGMPYYISFDHDLGGDETVMEFLRWLAYDFYDKNTMEIPQYRIHSANSVGAKNIESFMESWKKSIQI